MKKRKRLGPVETIVNRNEKRNSKVKEVRPNISGGHPGKPRARGMVPITRTRLILADAFIRSRSFLDLVRCFNRQFFSESEAKSYIGNEKLVKEGRNLRYRRWQWALTWFSSMMPKPSVSESSTHLHLHGMSLTQAAKEPGKATEIGFDVMNRVKQIAETPVNKKLLELRQRHELERKRVLEEIKEDEKQTNEELREEMERLPAGKDFVEGQFEEMGDEEYG